MFTALLANTKSLLFAAAMTLALVSLTSSGVIAGGGGGGDFTSCSIGAERYCDCEGAAGWGCEGGWCTANTCIWSDNFNCSRDCTCFCPGGGDGGGGGIED